MKTAITVLQEMMVKLGHHMPEYECISQTGPHHLVMFEFKCVAEGVTVTAQARSKKEAKQEAARKMLLQLHTRGYEVAHPYNTPRGDELDDVSPPPSPIKKPALEGAGGGCGAPASVVADARSYVALLRELCEQYRLGAVEYELTGDTGPAHQRRFVVSARLGQHAHTAAAGTKKAARQLAAERLYHYLRENLVTTRDFCEEEAMSRALEKAMERYVDAREGDKWRVDLSQKVAEYHLGLCTYTDVEVRRRALEELARPGCSERERLEGVAAVLGLRLEPGELPGGVSLLSLALANPPLVFAGAGPDAVAAAAARHLRRALVAEGLTPTSS